MAALSTADETFRAWNVPKEGVTHRRVLVTIVGSATSGEIVRQLWDGTTWGNETTPVSHPTIAALETAVDAEITAAEAANAAEVRETIEDGFAEAMVTGLSIRAVTGVTKAKVRAAMAADAAAYKVDRA